MMIQKGEKTIKELISGYIDYDIKKDFFADSDDSVNHPSHYTRGNIEVLDFIEDQKLDYHKGNAVKYICRAGFKPGNTELQDIEKAITYLKRKADILRGAK